MGGEQAAQVMVTVRESQLNAQGKELSDDERKEISAPLLAKFERESSAYYASARLWDDGVIDPRDTRNVLGLALEACANGGPIPDTNFGIFRM